MSHSHRLMRVLLVITLVGLAVAKPAGAQICYIITDLGDLGGGNTFAYDINNSGQVVGISSLSSAATRAFRTASNKSIDPLKDGLGSRDSAAARLNNQGEVAGTTRVGAESRAAVFGDGGQVRELGTLGGNWSQAYGINNFGAVVGASLTDKGVKRAFRTAPGAGINPATDSISSGNDDLDGVATAINDKGVVVGKLTLQSGEKRGFRYDPVGGLSYLPTLGGPEIDLQDINNRGQIVGWSSTADNKSRACLWENGQVTDLGTLGGATSAAYGINSAGQVVGTADVSPSYRFYPFHSPFLYTNGKLYNLNDLLPKDLGWLLLEAYSINDNGQIVAFGFRGGRVRTCLLTPAPSGVRVRVTRQNGDESEEVLVAFYDNSVVFRRHLSPFFEPNATLPEGEPISKIRTIELIQNPGDSTESDRFIKYGFNKLIAVGVNPTSKSSNTTRTIELEKTALSNGVWHYVINSIGIGDDRESQQKLVSSFYGVPRCPGTNDATRRKADPSTDIATRDILTVVGHSQDVHIPPAILYAAAWHESRPPTVGSRYGGLGWNQFGFITARVAGITNVVPQDDPPGEELTLVTYDGGIGMMQLTGDVALNSSRPPGANLLIHLHNLAHDMQYNVAAGARVLLAKKAQTARFLIGNDEASVLEHWYNALWAYNGLVPQDKSAIYPNMLWSEMSAPPNNRWEAPTLDRTIHLNSYEVAQGNGKYFVAAHDTLDGNGEPQAAHIDLDFDGRTDVELFSPEVKVMGREFQLSVHVRAASLREIKARVANAQVSIDPKSFEIVLQDPDRDGTYEGRWTGDLTPFARPFISFTVTTSVGMSQGVTYSPDR